MTVRARVAMAATLRPSTPPHPHHFARADPAPAGHGAPQPHIECTICIACTPKRVITVRQRRRRPGCEPTPHLPISARQIHDHSINTQVSDPAPPKINNLGPSQVVLRRPRSVACCRPTC